MSDIPELFAVLDIGGGSTEISMGSPGAVTESVSLDIGSVRLTERFFTTLPPSQSEIDAAKSCIDQLLMANIIPFFAAREIIVLWVSFPGMRTSVWKWLRKWQALAQRQFLS